ncbi:MAG: SMP-30/gluconolactonase/LRE family protein [Anaerolineae bacterium]
MEPVLIADYQCITGEGPLWHPDERRLYWVDIPTGRLFRYAPATGFHEQCYSGPVVGGFTLQADGKLLLFMDKGAIRVWRDGFFETIVESIPAEQDSRFNDVIADPEGRVFCGTMATREHDARLYRLDRDGSLHVVVEGVGVSNGMGFTPDGKGLYYTDTRRRTIDLFDYDRSTGEIANRRIFAAVPDGEGGPDGMTVDAEGMVWSARWGGSCVVRYDAAGNVARRITFPAKKVSCPAFGGPDYADLYVTTAGGNNKPEEGAGAGALFRVDTGVRGVPEFRSRIGL